MEQAQTKRLRGFAAMDRDRVKAIARAGGKAAHAKGVAHRFTTDEARAAGRKGGLAYHARRGHRLDSGSVVEEDEEALPETQRAPQTRPPVEFVP